MDYKVTKIGQSGSVKLNTKGLNLLLLGIKENYKVHIGILGGSASQVKERKEAGKLAKSGGHKASKIASIITNAEVGLIHEKGSKTQNIPRRSWLEVPLQDKLGEYFVKLGATTIREILKDQPKQAYNELGIVCEQIIQKGFETGGYGKWKALSSKTIARKKSSAILIDTAQLRRSISSEVVKP